MNEVRGSMLKVAFMLAGLHGTACLPASYKDCGGGSVCPIDKVCLAQGGCAAPEQLAACDSKSDNDACTFAGSVGRCLGGVCVGALCGNHKIDPGELCDDGNTSSGDGCRADCLKIEVCGDGIVDEGEDCDDGNQNSADGCDLCTATTWTVGAVAGTVDASSIGFGTMFGIAADHDGNVYFSDQERYRVWRIDRGGALTSIAGTGTLGFSGDGGPASSAQLGYPTGVAVDGLGNVFVGDSSTFRVRRIDPNGLITTVAGNGTKCSPIDSACGDDGPAISAQFALPDSLAVDAVTRRA
jgi:cysteine-rich repeat protein